MQAEIIRPSVGDSAKGEIQGIVEIYGLLRAATFNSQKADEISRQLQVFANKLHDFHGAESPGVLEIIHAIRWALLGDTLRLQWLGIAVDSPEIQLQLSRQGLTGDALLRAEILAAKDIMLETIF